MQRDTPIHPTPPQRSSFSSALYSWRWPANLSHLEVGCRGAGIVAKRILRQVSHCPGVGQPAARVLCCRCLHVLRAHLCTPQDQQAKSSRKGRGGVSSQRNLRCTIPTRMVLVSTDQLSTHLEWRRPGWRPPPARRWRPGPARGPQRAQHRPPAPPADYRAGQGKAAHARVQCVLHTQSNGCMITCRVNGNQAARQTGRVPTC